MADRVPLVDYLVLDDGPPHLVARMCDRCGALYLDRRNACAQCGADAHEFSPQRLADEGVLRAFTIVHRAAPGVPAPFISAVVDLDGGGRVNANLVEIDPDPEKIALNSRVRLTTYPVGTDDEDTEAIAFGFVLA
ncbi:MAG TPA: OB-fold domain-containing protein [Acidimicrobiales bacterium]|nr:OB-fold domain-containing protein [Acidimicrobiales bacterium]